MDQDEHLAIAILNEIYDTKGPDRIAVMAKWIAAIRSRPLKNMSFDGIEAEYSRRANTAG